MEFAVVGGDARFAYLARMLRSCGRDARAIRRDDGGVGGLVRAEAEDLNEAKNVIMNWPVNQGNEILERLSPGTRVYFCGPSEPEEIPEGIRAVDLWKDEQLLLENAWLTAEGAVSAVMNKGKAALKDCHCLIIGWGRIGRALTEILVGMNVRVTVASRSEKGRNGAIERGADSVSTYNIGDFLPNVRIVFSTAPQQVLGEAELRCMNEEALIVDLASAPYGVDLQAAERLKLNAWREPGLPGRYCPFSAAKALMRAIIRAERMYGV